MARLTALVDSIIDYEAGDLSALQTLELFSLLICDDLLTGLQGHYGRQAAALVDGGYLTPDGEITDLAFDTLAEEA